MAKVERKVLEAMSLSALRLLGQEGGIADAAMLGRAALIDQLATTPPESSSTETLAVPAPPLPSSSPSSSSWASSPTLPLSPLAGTPVETEPLGLLDFEELPETYDVDECEVLFKDPHTVLVYWEVTNRGLDAARAQLGTSGEKARLVLRLYLTDGDHRTVTDTELGWNHGRRYLQVPRAFSQVRVATGLISPEGYFAPVAHSMLVRLPPSSAAPRGAAQWMEVTPLKSRGREREVMSIRTSVAGERPLPGKFSSLSQNARTGSSSRPLSEGLPSSSSAPTSPGTKP